MKLLKDTANLKEGQYYLLYNDLVGVAYKEMILCQFNGVKPRLDSGTDFNTFKMSKLKLGSKTFGKRSMNTENSTAMCECRKGRNMLSILIYELDDDDVNKHVVMEEI